ncbi:MAG TPA: hydroxyisourate hydrolase [Bryobacteraceae bacterium]|jgi:5-hydroxyisourate hydrolase|nr:hydroxyisourate hydrolase [Bryobacteraceae bacterium]
MARISTHVLDIAKGKPAAGVAVELYFGGELIASATTNADGRTDAPLLSAGEIQPGRYELLFHAGPYLKSSGTPEPLFFDEIRLQFAVADACANYHVPLLLAAHGYSTYRGS